ncbi:MAG: MipA/OmpV family protein [Beijerinckiaceae bacterium]
MRILAYAAAGLACVCATAVQAQTFSTDTQGKQGWLVSIKANAVAGPSWPGARGYDIVAFPSLSVRRAGSNAGFSAPDDGIGWALFDNGIARAGLVGQFVSGRSFGNDPKYVGLHSIKWGGEIGGFAEFWALPNTLRARIEMRHGLIAHRGLVMDAGLDAIHQWGQHTLSIGPRLSLGSEKYANRYFGVSAAEAALNPNVTAYKAGGGLTSYGALAAVQTAWTPNWSTTLYARYRRLSGEAAASPIVRNLGTPNQLTIGASVAYTFNFSGF